MEKEKYICVGKIVNTQGLKGHVKIYPYTSRKEDFKPLKYLWVQKPYSEEKVELTIDSKRYHKNLVIMSFKGFGTIEDVESYKDCLVYAKKQDLYDGDKDSFFYSDILGFQVVDEKKGCVGVLEEITQGAVQDIFSIKTKKGNVFFVPCVKAFVKSFDMDKHIVHVSLIEGMME